MSTLKVDTILKRTGTGTITVGQSGDTISIPSGATLNSAGTNTLEGIANTPYFEARRSSSQTISDNTNTKIACDVETWDSAGNYDNSTNYRFTPTTAGKYYIYGQAVCSIAQEQIVRYSLFIRKNGSDVKYMSYYFTGNPAYIVPSYVATVIDFNGSSDYVELWCKIQKASSGTIVIDGGTPGPTFGGYRMIGA